MSKPSRKKTFIHRHSLSLVLLLLFFGSWIGQALMGWHVFNEESAESGKPVLALFAYLGTPHFWSSTFENWESEFLQMGIFVVLTVCLREEGSSESKPCDESDEDEEKKYPCRYFKHSPVLRWFYERSLSFALFILFIFSFLGHSRFSWLSHVREKGTKGEPLPSYGEYLRSADLWFESFQNWQSEFLSVAVLVVLTIYLRHRGSAQSKAVDAPHSENE